MRCWPDTDRPAIIVANHTGWLDGPALAWLTPKPILFGVDPDFSLRRPWRGLMLWWAGVCGTGCEIVPMSPGCATGLRAMLRRLRAGGWVCLFPEGGIGTGTEYPGADWLASKTGAPVHRLRIRSAGFRKLRIPLRIAADAECDRIAGMIGKNRSFPSVASSRECEN